MRELATLEKILSFWLEKQEPDLVSLKKAVKERIKTLKARKWRR